MYKKIIFLTLTFLVLCISVSALPSPANEFYVNDFANVIDADAEKHIVNISAQIEKSTGAQIVVAAFQNIEGMTEAEYALKIGREWGIGDEKKDNGVLLMLALEERGVRIEVGLGLEGALPDGKCGRIIDEEIIPYFAEGDWSQGFLKGYDRIVAEVCKEYGIEIPEEVDAIPYEEDDEGGWVAVAVILIILIIYFNLIKKIPPSHRGRGGMFYPGGFYGGFGGRGGGGFSGGGFSGGGGSFGGGGASRRF